MAETNLVCFTAEVDDELLRSPADPKDSPSRQRPPPPQYPVSEASGPSAFRPPPSFSSLFPTQHHDDAPGSVLEPCEPYKATVADPGDTASTSAAAPAYAPPDQVAPESSNSASAALRLQDETKRALPQDTKGHAGSSKDDEAEPPPAYSEGSSPPLHSFTYLMAAAGGAASILTQVQQGGPSINPLGDVPGDETIVMDLRYDSPGDRFHAISLTIRIGVPASSCRETSCSHYPSLCSSRFSPTGSSPKGTWVGSRKEMPFKLM